MKQGFHAYSKWTRDNLEQLEESVFSGYIERSGAFNLRAVVKIFQTFKKYKFIQSGRLLEIMLWLGSFGMLLEKLDVPPVIIGAKERGLPLYHRLELFGTLAGQYQAFGRRMPKVP